MNNGDLKSAIKTLKRPYARRARALIDRGFEPTEYWGPVQMACALVRLEKGSLIVDVTAERGYSHAALVLGERGLRWDAPTLIWAHALSNPSDAGSKALSPRARTEAWWMSPNEYPQWHRVGLKEFVAVCEWAAAADAPLIDKLDDFVNGREEARKHREAQRQGLASAEASPLGWASAAVRMRNRGSELNVSDRDHALLDAAWEQWTVGDRRV